MQAIYYGYEYQRFKDIARRADNAQINRDVQMMRVVEHNTKLIIFGLSCDCSCIFGYYTKENDLRIVGLATAKEFERQGYATMLLLYTMDEVKKRGGKRLYTRTKSGLQFYLKNGFRKYKQNGDEYYLELYV